MHNAFKKRCLAIARLVVKAFNLHALVAVHLVLLLASSTVLAQPITFVEFIETFDYNTTNYAYAYLASFYNGKAVFIDPYSTMIGFVGYTGFPADTKDLLITSVIRVSNESCIAFWITPTDPSDYIGDEITETTDIKKIMVGPGVSIAVTSTGIYVRYTDASGVVYGTLLHASMIESYAFEKGEDCADYQITIRLSKVYEYRWMLSVYVGSTQIFGGNVWNINPTYVVAVGAGAARSQPVYLDIITLYASTFSQSEVVMPPPVTAPAVAIAPSLLLMPYNSTAIYILYMCYYRESPAECPPTTVKLIANGNIIYNKTIIAEETESHLYVYRDIVNVGYESVSYEIYINGVLYRSGTISIPAVAPLYANPYTELIASLMPIAVAVSLGVKTSSIRNIGLGLVSAGLVIMVLPMIGIFSPNMYMSSMLCIAIGGIILFFYRTS